MNTRRSSRRLSSTSIRSLKTGKITDEVRKEIKDTFKLFDVDDDGKISTKEIKNVFESLGMSPNTQEIDEVVCRIDTDGNGSIDYAEFEDFVTTSGFLKSLPDETDTEMMDAFQMLDVDGDGYITVEELKEFLSKFDNKSHDKEAEELIKNADENGDRKIDYSEFKNLAANL